MIEKELEVARFKSTPLRRPRWHLSEVKIIKKSDHKVGEMLAKQIKRSKRSMSMDFRMVDDITDLYYKRIDFERMLNPCKSDSESQDEEVEGGKNIDDEQELYPKYIF